MTEAQEKVLARYVVMLPPPWENYMLTRDGDVYNKRGRKLKPQMQEGAVFIRTTINGKTRLFDLAQAVYHNFVEPRSKRHKVYHNDGDPWNNKAENLSTCPITHTAEQEKAYTEEIEKTVRMFIVCRNLAPLQRDGFDLDDFISDCYLQCWKYLGSFDSNKCKFVTWARHYMEYTFMSHYKKFKQKCETEIPYEASKNLKWKLGV